MSLSALTPLLGGVGLFLLGMWLMTEGLKLAAGGALQAVLESWTSSAARAFLTGAMITAILQSSSAVTVATLGFVNAGLLSLAQAVWLIVGANVGTTMTGWLVAAVGVKVDVAALALPLIGLGMLGRLIFRGRTRSYGLGQAVAGFGVFFLGVGVLQDGFGELLTEIGPLSADAPTRLTLLAALGAGIAVTVLTQSSSAAIALTLTAAASGETSILLPAMAVIGTNIGTTSTAIFAALSATPSARRVASAHVIFNLIAAACALILLGPLLTLSQGLTARLGGGGDAPATLAMFHTLFNLIGVAPMALLGPHLIGFLQRRFVSADENLSRPRYLDATVAPVPALALRGLVLEVERMREAAFDTVAQRRNVAEVAQGAPGPRLQALGQAIRAFVGEMSSAPLPAPVVDAVPDIIRAVQHLEEIERISLRLRPIIGVVLATSASWADLQAALTDSLAGEKAMADREDQVHDRLIQRAEEAYQTVKSDLLRATARGALPVTQLDEALDLADAIRRCAELAAKTNRRLAPWEGHPDEAHSEIQGLSRAVS